MRHRSSIPIPRESLLLEWSNKGSSFNSFLSLVAVALLLVVCPCSDCILDSCLDLTTAGPSVPFAAAFSTFHRIEARVSFRKSNLNQNSVLHAYKPVVVVGKIIIDEYGDPYPDSDEQNYKQIEKESEPPTPPKSVTIGGGGPQAAFGAAAALSVWDTYYKERESNETLVSEPLPPVIFVAPVGEDWTDSETTALESSSLGASASVIVHQNSVGALGRASSNTENVPMIQTHLIVKNTKSDDEEERNENGYFTPRIRLWHDLDQVCHWYALNDSFGPKGADGLWRNNPSAEDLISILDSSDLDNKNNIVLHAIAETWTGAAGGKLDFLPIIQDKTTSLRNQLCFVGVEPVASGETVTKEDAREAASVLAKCCEIIGEDSSCDTVFWCPDKDLDEAIQKNDLYQNDNNTIGLVQLAAIRDGPRGSTTRITESSVELNEEKHVPAAVLATKDGSPVDPTGAGNAYSGAMTALLGNQVPVSKAACIATGVGAVVCEHEGLPPQSEWEKTLERIASAALEVELKIVGTS